jgi:hypothetical protein
MIMKGDDLIAAQIRFREHPIAASTGVPYLSDSGEKMGVFSPLVASRRSRTDASTWRRREGGHRSAKINPKWLTRDLWGGESLSTSGGGAALGRRDAIRSTQPSPLAVLPFALTVVVLIALMIIRQLHIRVADSTFTRCGEASIASAG